MPRSSCATTPGCVAIAPITLRIGRFCNSSLVSMRTMFVAPLFTIGRCAMISTGFNSTSVELSVKFTSDVRSLLTLIPFVVTSW